MNDIVVLEVCAPKKESTLFVPIDNSGSLESGSFPYIFFCEENKESRTLKSCAENKQTLCFLLGKYIQGEPFCLGLHSAVKKSLGNFLSPDIVCSKWKYLSSKFAPRELVPEKTNDEIVFWRAWHIFFFKL